MKKFLTILSFCVFAVSAVLADETAAKNEGIMDNITFQAQDMAETAVDNVKTGAQKTGLFIKQKSIMVGKTTAKHAKKGAKKAKNATIRGVNQVGNTTAKGFKKAGEKIQSSAESAIEATEKNLKTTDTQTDVTDKTPCEIKQKCKCCNKCKCNNIEN